MVYIVFFFSPDIWSAFNLYLNFREHFPSNSTNIFFFTLKAGKGLSCTIYKIPVNFSFYLKRKPGPNNQNNPHRKDCTYRYTIGIIYDVPTIHGETPAWPTLRLTPCPFYDEWRLGTNFLHPSILSYGHQDFPQ